MKRENQPGYIPHVGPVSPTRTIRQHHKTPADKIKGASERLLEHGVEVIKSLASYRADAVLLTGKEKHGGEPLRVFYFGVGENLAYLAELLFHAHEAAVQAADVNPWRARAWCQKFQAGVDLVILDLPWPVNKMVRRGGFLALAPWVNMVIPIGVTWESVVGRWAKNVRGEDLRRIRKHQLNFRTLDSEQAFRNFYHDLYVPYVTLRFGDAVFTGEYRHSVDAKGRLATGQVDFAHGDAHAARSLHPDLPRVGKGSRIVGADVLGPRSDAGASVSIRLAHRTHLRRRGLRARSAALESFSTLAALPTPVSTGSGSKGRSQPRPAARRASGAGAPGGS